MRTFIATAAVMALLMASAPAQAQYLFPDPTTLVGPGSSIGARVRELTGDEAKAAKLDAQGVYITEVTADTPAARAGLTSGDIVIEFDGERVRGVRSFTRLVSETPPGRTVKTMVVRDGARKTLDLTPEAGRRFGLNRLPALPRDLPLLRPAPAPRPRDFQPDTPRPDIAPSPRRLGVGLTTLTGQLAAYFGVPSGALVSSVDENSPASRAGLRAGDVITAINGRAVRRPTEVSEAVRDASPGSSLELKVVREKKEMTLRVELPAGRALSGQPI